MEAGKSKILGVPCGRLETQGRACGIGQVGMLSVGRILSCWLRSTICSVQAFKCLNEAHHIVRDNLLHSKSTNLNINHIQNCHRNIQNKV